MAILYALVARGQIVLAEYASVPGNAHTIARRILENFPPGGDSRMSYSQDRHIFHVMRLDGLVFLCMASETFGRRIPYAFLEDIHTRFTRTYGRAGQTALSYAMNDEFSRVLHQQMDFFSNDPNADAINRVKGEITDVRSIMVQNIDKILERGDRLELLVDKTAHIEDNAFRFKKQARKARHAQWMQTLKLSACLALVILVLIFVVVTFFCGGITFQSCR
ncbi:hypothetical protein SELMODRAFT_80138 [Selaginella moellendorffii]|uniref:Uncharacterized protein n=1 Tax=Selaginella moellendorffii TaxID=88036 RepID=D8QYH3_SELML|nr:vesicle-associated membrane protein 711 [Selaginella moellendorffii]EFJ35612.1 hypothetical protein SELMODRAFT_80138 [Selaginella moellendorffii]|eukprot:XP_002963741.1 vesicle-associated membrane protein 711 [Selaginella moellendorffii]